MNRREAITSLAVAASVPFAYKTVPKPEPTKSDFLPGEVRSIQSDLALLNDSPISRIRVTVFLKEGHPEFYHPLDFAKAARYYAGSMENASALYAKAFGPYKNEIDLGNGPKPLSEL